MQPFVKEVKTFSVSDIFNNYFINYYTNQRFKKRIVTNIERDNIADLVNCLKEYEKLPLYVYNSEIVTLLKLYSLTYMINEKICLGFTNEIENSNKH